MLTIINSRLLICLTFGVSLAAYLIDARSASVSKPSTNFQDETKKISEYFFPHPSYPKGGFGYSDDLWMQWGSNYKDVGYGQVGTKPWNEEGHFGFGHGSSLEDYFDDYYYPTDDGYYPFIPIPANPEIWYPGDPFDNPYPPKPIGPVGWNPPAFDPFFPFDPSKPYPGLGNEKNPHGVVLDAGNGNVVIQGNHVHVVGGSRNGKPQFSNVPVIPVIPTYRPKKRQNKKH